MLLHFITDGDRAFVLEVDSLAGLQGERCLQRWRLLVDFNDNSEWSLELQMRCAAHGLRFEFESAAGHAFRPKP